MASPPTGSAWSETPGTRRHSLHGNREGSSPPRPSGAGAALGRRKPYANDARRGEVGLRCSSREVAEQNRETGRGGDGAKSGGQGECGTAEQRNTDRTQSRESVLQSLGRIRQAAKRDKR